MRVKPITPEYDVFHLESRGQLTELRDWLRERGWLMQIQEWEDVGYFRPSDYLNTNWLDRYFTIGQYILVDTVENDWHVKSIVTTASLDKFHQTG